MRNKLLFDHMPKTGGTSLVTVLEQIIGQDNIASVFGDNARKACDRLNNKTVISGHMSFYPGEHLDTERYCLTILRNPIDRVLSAYDFFRNNPNALVTKSVELANQLKLEDYLECEDSVVRDEVVNAQTNHYYYIGHDGSADCSDEAKLAAAKRALDSYNLVGGLEQFEDFVDVLCFEQGWSADLEMPRENKTVKRTKVSDIPAPIRQRLEELNKLDIELYQYACKLFNAHRRRIIRACIEQRNLGNQGFAASYASTAKPESLSSTHSVKQPSKVIDFGDHSAEIISATVLGDLLGSTQILSGEMFVCNVIFKANEDIPDLTVGIHIYSQEGLLVYGINSRLLDSKLSVAGGAEYFIKFVARCDLGIGNYTIGVALHPGTSHLQRCFHWREKVSTFDVIGNLGYQSVGAVKLYPQIQYGSLDPLNGSLLSERLIEKNAAFNILAHHLPALIDFSATIKCLAAEPVTLSVGQIFEVEIEVCNSSQNKWPSIGLRQVNVSYHWLDSVGNLLLYDGKRTPLPCDVEPGKTVRMWASVIAPTQPGDARLQITLVQEHVGWFDECGSLPAEIKVLVSPC